MSEQQQSDREVLEMAEAREILRHKAAGGSDEYIKARSLVVDRLYGKGSRERIREKMKHIKANNE